MIDNYKMADISTFDNFFDKFTPKSGFAAKSLSQWKEWESSTIQNVWQILPPTFLHCFQGQFDIHLGYEIRSFLFLEQCFQLSLSDEIGYTFVDDFLTIPKYFFDIDNLPITWKMPMYWLSIIFSIISTTYTHGGSKLPS